MGGRDKTILVVDDDFASLSVLALLLRGEGYCVVTASDGEEALGVLRAAPADLVICDYKMPRLNGLDLLARMGDDPRLAPIPALLMSATYRPPPGPARHTAFLAKPLRFDDLLAAVERAFGSSPG